MIFEFYIGIAFLSSFGFGLFIGFLFGARALKLGGRNIKNLRPTAGYQPIEKGMDITNPPRSGSGLK